MGCVIWVSYAFHSYLSFNEIQRDSEWDLEWDSKYRIGFHICISECRIGFHISMHFRMQNCISEWDLERVSGNRFLKFRIAFLKFRMRLRMSSRMSFRMRFRLSFRMRFRMRIRMRFRKQNCISEMQNCISQMQNQNALYSYVFQKLESTLPDKDVSKTPRSLLAVKNL